MEKLTLNLLLPGMEVQMISTQTEEDSQNIAFGSTDPSCHLLSDEGEPSCLEINEAAVQVNNFNNLIFF